MQAMSLEALQVMEYSKKGDLEGIKKIAKISPGALRELMLRSESGVHVPSFHEFFFLSFDEFHGQMRRIWAASHQHIMQFATVTRPSLNTVRTYSVACFTATHIFGASKCQALPNPKNCLYASSTAEEAAFSKHMHICTFFFMDGCTKKRIQNMAKFSRGHVN
jgi:hypothetical protein